MDNWRKQTSFSKEYIPMGNRYITNHQRSVDSFKIVRQCILNSYCKIKICELLQFSKCRMCVCASHSVVSRFFVTPWTVTRQAPLSMEFSRQEYWSGLPCPAPGDLPNPGIEPRFPALHTDSLPFVPPGKPIIQDF